MNIDLIFRKLDGTVITNCTVEADNPVQASEYITQVLLEVYAKHGPGVSIEQLPVIR